MLSLEGEEMSQCLKMQFAGMRIREIAYLDGSKLAKLQVCGTRKATMDWLFPRDGLLPPVDDDEAGNIQR